MTTIVDNNMQLVTRYKSMLFSYYFSFLYNTISVNAAANKRCCCIRENLEFLLLVKKKNNRPLCRLLLHKFSLAEVVVGVECHTALLGK